MIDLAAIERNLNILSQAYEQGKVPPVPLEIAPKGYADLLGASKTHLTGQRIHRIDLWRGYPVAHLRRPVAESVIRMMNPFSGTAMLYRGLIVQIDPIPILPRAITHEAWHFLDWAGDPERFIWWLQNWQNKVPLVGYITSPLEIYAYANQLAFWRKVPSIAGPAASRYHKALCHHWAELSGRTGAQLFGKVSD